MVKGVLYTTAGSRRAVVALDAATGELLWVHGYPEGARGAAAPRQLSGRGLAYWTDGKEERILYFTPGYRLIALNAKTGMRIPSFGRDGVVDLKLDFDQQIDLVTGEVGLHSTPAIAGDLVIVGAAFREGQTPKTHNNTRGYVRAFDVRTGKRVWIFHTIPRPGEFGNDTWLNDSWAVNGNTGVWNHVAVDEELGLAYLPVETPSSDFYGGHRPGQQPVRREPGRGGSQDRKAALALPARAPSALEHGHRDGADARRHQRSAASRSRPSRSWASRRGSTCSIALTGQPVWPIEERPVPQGDVPGEWYSPTQPHPTRPPPYDHQGVTIDNLIDFTPELRAEAVKLLSQYKLGPIFTPPPVSKVGGPIAGFRSSGGTNWPGGSYDPETHVAYVPSFTSMVPLGLLPPPSREFSDANYVMGTVINGVRYVSGPGERRRRRCAAAGAQRGADRSNRRRRRQHQSERPAVSEAALRPDHAIDLDRGEIVWQVAAR